MIKGRAYYLASINYMLRGLVKSNDIGRPCPGLHHTTIIFSYLIDIKVLINFL